MLIFPVLSVPRDVTTANFGGLRPSNLSEVSGSGGEFVGRNVSGIVIIHLWTKLETMFYSLNWELILFFHVVIFLIS